MEPNTKKQTAALYLRKSHDDGDGIASRSIKGQRDELKRLAEAHGLTIVTEFNEGAGVGASSLSGQERPQWEQALAEMGHTYDVLLGWALDRLTRGGMGDVAQLFDLVEERGARVLTADGFDTTNQAARFMGGFMAEQARAESHNTSERIRRGKKQQREQGAFPGGRPGYGLLAIKEDGKIVDLVVDPDKATAIEFAAELICDGGSLGDACNALNERGDRTMAGNTWATSVLHRTLASPHLIGHRLQKGVMFSDDDGNPVQVHDAVIPAALWHRVNRTLSQRSSSKSPRRRGTNRPKSLVGSLLKCAECGSGFTQNCKENGNHYYRCHTCRVPTHSIRLDLADAHIARSALNFLSSLDADSAIIGEVGRRWLARFSPEQLGRHEAIQDELGLLRNKAAELQIAYFERSTMEHDVYERLEQRFTGQIERLESELHTTPRPTADLSPLFDLAQSSDNPDGDIVGEGSAWMALPLHQRREIILCLVDKVIVERRARASDDIEGRLIIECASEDNVVNLGSRPKRQVRAFLDLKAQVADLKIA